MGDDQQSAPQPKPQVQSKPQAASSAVAPTTTASTTAPTVAAKSILPADIVWIDMPSSHTRGSEQQKQRPWLVVSTKRFNQGPLGLIIAVPLSSQIALLSVKVPSRVRVENGHLTYADNGLPVQYKLQRIDRVALCDQVRTLSEKRILARAAQANTRILDSARVGIAFNLDL